MKKLRAGWRGETARNIARQVSQNLSASLATLRSGLDACDKAHGVLGEWTMDWIGGALHQGFGMPRWNSQLPKAARSLRAEEVVGSGAFEVVYFPSCIARTMGPSRKDPDQRSTFEAMLSVLKKACVCVLFPEDLENLCCGLAFESKGFPEPAEAKLRELERALLVRSEDGRIPILCDTSPCTYRMARHLDPRLKLYEPVEYIHTFLMNRLAFQRGTEPIAVHVTCSSQKMGLAQKFKAVAAACSEKVIVPESSGCCGFAGDRGFSHPELNRSALGLIRTELPEGAIGVSNSRTCEIGLSLHSGIQFQSIAHLVDHYTR